ncbi:hypothetical protein CC86DRAFT_60753 [Ophiobolus disseminans]|uniref:Extracellular membrane protein CFEM domain-containing protein n=1 Tax=Ophiobolus disseminans TaxID=1469910 RepID=A0A6A6ZU51_9PLEO|nr:hypothetical protein CC86DRAFT_60753 [Ophiobolus disseminans]
MLFQKLAIVSALAAFAAAQDVDNSDVPQQCRAVCADVVATSQRCDNETNDDRAEVDCICRSQNAATLIPACDACVQQFDTDNDDPNDVSDVRELLTRCNFTTTTYNSASASSILQSVASSFASASGSVVVTTSGTVVLTTSIPARTSVLAQSTAAAPAQTAAAGAAMGLGALGLAMGLL